MKRDRSIQWTRVDAARLDLKGIKAAIVGGTGGLGRALAQVLASRGASVIVVGQTFRDSATRGIEFIKADLSLMSEAERAAALLPSETLDVVIFTTGIFAAPKREETAEGIERDMAVSFLSRLVMLRLIAPRLGKNRPGAAMKPRVFIMGYPGSGQIGNLDDLNAERSYGALATHMNTVAGNEMLVLDSARRYSHATIFGLNPGLIKTNIRSNFLGAYKLLFRFSEWVIGLLGPDAATYAKHIVPLLVSPDIEQHSGAMFDQKGRAILPSAGLTESHVRAFLTTSEALASRGKTMSPSHRLSDSLPKTSTT
jgi:NAD(P)-dependent dehydrogenase (short-subunit alcohol dehydrogenase family)